MALERFNCKNCGQVTVHSIKGEAVCRNCGAQYIPNMREIAKIASIVPLSLFLAFAVGQWWLLLVALPAGALWALKIDRDGSKWQLEKHELRS